MSSAAVIKNARWKRRSSDDGFVSHQDGSESSRPVLRFSKMRIKWYHKAILSCLMVALVLISNCGWLTLVSIDTFFASSYLIILLDFNHLNNGALIGELSQLRGAWHSGNTKHHSLYIPHSLSLEDGRRVLSINLGGGACQWKPPVYDVPENIDFHKTVIAGYPSGDKRMVFMQMEALTGWPTKDEWDFWGSGMSNHPFIKANYPHHEGIWGWDDAADQVVMVVRNIRKSMVECKFNLFRFRLLL